MGITEDVIGERVAVSSGMLNSEMTGFGVAVLSNYKG